MSRADTDQRAALTAKLLRQRRIIRNTVFCILALLVVSVIADHLGAFGYPGDDWRHFDHQNFVITRVIDGDTVCVSYAGSNRETRVRLLGIDAPKMRAGTTIPPDYWADRSLSYASVRMTGKSVTLRLEPTETRDRDGELLAYLYLTDSDNLNLDLVHDGQAYADRRFKHSLQSQFDLAENEARKKKRGLWEKVTESQMPPWRQRWLRELRAKDTTRP